MRGDFIGVWSETWREIWAPLIEREDVPEDIFCELYRDLASALRDPTDEDALELTISDAIQLREAFARAPLLAESGIELAQVHSMFDASGATELRESSKRRAAVETALAPLIGDAVKARALLDQSLSEIAGDPQKRAEAKQRAIEDVVNNPETSRLAFERVQSHDIAGERAIVTFLEAAHGALEGIGGDPLANCYFNLLTAFVEKFSLRYDLRRPCTLCPTLPGMFASLVRDLRASTGRDAHLDALMKEFESAIRDLRTDCSDGRIKTCIQKQMNLLEAIGRKCPGVTSTTLGAICNEVGTWPHEKVKEAMKSLYGFASDYPGIRHGGTRASALRVIEMRDLVAMAVLLAGFTPYLSDQLDADVVYRGG